MSDDSSSRRTVWLREYETLREESLQSMGNRTQIISFSLGTIAILVGGTLAAPSLAPQLKMTMFNLVIPLVSVLAYYAWFAELERMARAGRFIQRLEQKINTSLSEEVLSWETYLESNRMRYPYLIVAMLFLGVATGAPYVGVWIRQDPAATGTGLLRLPPGVNFATMVREAWMAWAAVCIAALHTGYRYFWVFRSYKPPPPKP